MKYSQVKEEKRQKYMLPTFKYKVVSCEVSVSNTYMKIKELEQSHKELVEAVNNMICEDVTDGTLENDLIRRGDILSLITSNNPSI